MKITTAFFRSNLVYNTLNNIIKNIMKILYFCPIVIACFMFVACFKIDKRIIMLATNTHNLNVLEFDLKDIKNIYAVFNQHNYCLNEIEKEEIITVENKKSDEVEIIDSINIEEGKKFFKDKKTLEINKTPTEVKDIITIDTMQIYDYSSNRENNYQELYNKDTILTKNSDKILLYSTHASESYENSEKYNFDYTGTYRTTNESYNMISVAKELSKNLTELGISTIHDVAGHDYGAYTSAYANSKASVQKQIASNGNFGISLDIHRDATGDLSFAPKANINGVEVAQCMIVLGAGPKSNKNPHFDDNLKLAIKLQLLAEKVYPGLFRPMLIRDSVYNQDLNKNSLLIEVGATGNTLDQVYLTTRCISNLLSMMYID